MNGSPFDLTGRVAVITGGYGVLGGALASGLAAAGARIAEVEAALEKGLTTLKFFPAEAMDGVETLKAISAPYSAVRFIPTGGLKGASLPSYLALKNVVACGGSWMAPRDWIAAGQFDRIREEVERTVSAVYRITER